MAIKIGGNNAIDDNRKGVFAKANFGSYTKAQLLGGSYNGSAAGDITFCSDSGPKGSVVAWDGSKWVGPSPLSLYNATGGTTNEVGSVKFHVFTSPGTFAIAPDSNSIACNIMVVAGGGAGGQQNEGHGGGGGGGMVDLPLSAPHNVALSVGTYAITVGSGGNQAAGGNSVFAGAPFGSLTGVGGGKYAGSGPSAAGGSGGGGRGDSPGPGTGTQPSQPGLSGNYGHGYPGGNGVGPEQGEGGGGAGGAGGGSPDNGFGGPGRKPPWMPTAFGDNGYFAGGGGAGVRNPGPSGGPGGQGGGSPGKRSAASDPGTPGTGGGAGGASEGYTPGNGGPGVVIIAYPI